MELSLEQCLAVAVAVHGANPLLVLVDVMVVEEE
jgi:hypothetical protein